MQVSFVEQHKSAWFESDFCVSCALHISNAVITMCLFWPAKFRQNFTNVTTPLGQNLLSACMQIQT